eukprot:TRINITY_DN2994_c0_g1_i1.p1 TRINITY_DN2994_c0_g1~~TRINITY_DN2994_c0_g1_i1.p1  ORF type:complete len:356 (-),score=75.16 TRINITY_DN2994_c0_g1_i1:12-1079(-)
MWGLFSKGDAKTEELKPVNVLVIQADDYDWEEIFKGKTLANGRPVVVKQTGWDKILVGPVDNYSKTNRCVITIRQTINPVKEKQMKEAGQKIVRRTETFFPDFVLVRNEVRLPTSDYRSRLYGLMYANIPSVNTLSSIYMFCERPIIQAELNRLNRELGNEVFPIMQQNFFAGHEELFYGLSFPAVVKVGHAHAGYGKMKINHHHDMEDFRTVLAMTEGKYCTAEPFIEAEYDLRIQKIGRHYRAFKRVSMSGAWKTNTGSSHLEEIPITDVYRRWVDESSKMFGGLDILTVDALHCRDGKEYILEVNGTSSGLGPEASEEDNFHIRELVLEKLNALYATPHPAAHAAAPSAAEQ